MYYNNTRNGRGHEQDRAPRKGFFQVVPMSMCLALRCVLFWNLEPSQNKALPDEVLAFRDPSLSLTKF